LCWQLPVCVYGLDGVAHTAFSVEHPDQVRRSGTQQTMFGPVAEGSQKLHIVAKVARNGGTPVAPFNLRLKGLCWGLWCEHHRHDVIEETEGGTVRSLSVGFAGRS